MSSRTIVDGPIRRPGVLEPRPAGSALPQSSGRAISLSTHFQSHRGGIGWNVQNSDVRQYQGRIPQERTADARTWLDVLHDVQATVLWAQKRERGSPSHVLVSSNGQRDLGRRSLRLPGV